MACVVMYFDESNDGLFALTARKVLDVLDH